MIFTELILQNFGPYAGRQVINLRPEKDNNPCPIVLLGGMNGGGKTTLMDAIRLALYGARAKCSTRNNLSYGEFLSQAVNHQASLIDQARIELAFEHLVNEQWRQYRIVRYWTKHPKDGKDILGILDEDWPDPALANTWDEYIETLLPLGISNLFLFDGEQVKELAEQDVPPASVKDSMQTLLGLELAERLAVDLDILASRKRRLLASEDELETIESIEKKLAKYQEDLELARQEMETWQKNLDVVRNDFDAVSDKFRIDGGKIAAERSQLEIRKKDLDKKLDKQREYLGLLAAELLPLKLIIPLLEKAKIQAEQEINFQSNKVAQTVLESRDKKLITHLKQLDLTLEQIQSIRDFLQQENQLLAQDSNSVITPYLDLDEEAIELLNRVLEHQLPAQINLAHQGIEQLRNLEADLDNLERELAVAASPEEYETLSNNLKNAQKNYLNAQAEYEQSHKNYEEIKKKIEKTKKELFSYSEKALESKSTEHIVNAITKAQETLQVFKERLTLKKLNKLEGEVSECFRYLLHKSDLVQKIAIDADTFGLSLFAPDGQNVPKHRLSAGEKQLLAIAFLWGLARVSGRDLPIAIDTPLGRLDSSHRHNLVERYFPSASSQVILLSTDTEIGQNELKLLEEQEVIARKYLLEYDSKQRQTTIHPDRYFW
jgi:DNA sulfur modification protein DndD